MVRSSPANVGDRALIPGLGRSSHTLATWCKEPRHWERPLFWERLRAGGEGGDRGWAGWMASLIQWTWTWENFRREWRTGKPITLQSLELQRATEQQGQLGGFHMPWGNWAQRLQLMSLHALEPVLCLQQEKCGEVKVALSCPTDLGPHGLYSPWNFPGQNAGVGSLSLLQGIFQTQGSNPGLLHCRRILYQLSQKESPRILEWVVYPFSRRYTQPRNWTGVSCIAGGFFINWAIR